jgi:lysophospholipase L1-like esterase
MKDSSSRYSGYTGFWVHTKDSSAAIRFAIGKEQKFHTGNSQVTLFYRSALGSTISVKALNLLKDSSQLYEPVYREILKKRELNEDWEILKLLFDTEIDAVEIELSDNDSTQGFTLHGAVIENASNKGVLYNSCGVGGAQFKHLIQNAAVPIGQAHALGTDLFIISFGSNESYTETFNYDIYKSSISAFISSLKKQNPGACILLTGPPDTRSKNRYPRNTASICAIFKELSLEQGFAYWDLRTAMGGDGSVMNWLKSGLASKDKLHFTKEGYFLQGKWLLDEIDKEYKKYNSILNKR